MLIKIYPENPNEKAIEQVVKCLQDGGIVIVPTDTVYSIVCDSSNIKAAERLSKIKGVEIEKSNFSFICTDLSHITDYTRPFDTSTYKMMKKALPGPFTFILEAGSKVPSKYFGAKTKKKTIGIHL
jgi:tRNA threonylcarbamoyl adenosine modification protein (Sua5/YciO/YrdC/YwlC family)